MILLVFLYYLNPILSNSHNSHGVVDSDNEFAEFEDDDADDEIIIDKDDNSHNAIYHGDSSQTKQNVEKLVRFFYLFCFKIISLITTAWCGCHL